MNHHPASALTVRWSLAGRLVEECEVVAVAEGADGFTASASYEG